jgi:vacuolar-type H+-ATPase subunit H
MTTTAADMGHESQALLDDPLLPVRDALLAAARRDAQALVAEAQQEGTRLLEQADAEADRLREAGRRDGEQDAEQVRRDLQARARRRGRGIVLAAQRDALEQLRRAVHHRLREIWDDEPSRARVTARLVDLARHDLGPTATITDHPAGGIVVGRDHTRATYLLTDLADQVIEDLGHDIAGLWTP